MTQPAYHLRPNKAVDRYTLVGAIRRLEKFENLSKYTYYGMGGPYLEDCRLIYENFPEIKMVSIERNSETLKQQQFHRPCGKNHLRLKDDEMANFLTSYSGSDLKSIFWLDYTGLNYSSFEDFEALLSKVGANSIVKITLQANHKDYRVRMVNGKERNGPEEFRGMFSGIMPDPKEDPPATDEAFAHYLQRMLQIVSQRALPGAFELMFLPVSSFYYADGIQMFSLTGMVCRRTDEKKIRQVFKNWEFANLDWGVPKKIDLPTLSTKERLHLQSQLPCAAKSSGRKLYKKLGYLIADNKKETELQLEQYANFHKHFPYFMKAVP